jgi:Protein of unknown function (DUF1569)
MKSMFEKTRIEEMKTRVAKLTPDSNAQWGKLTAHKMLCHLQDQMMYGLGMMAEVTDLEKGPPMFIRHLLRMFIPIPRGKVPTSDALRKMQPEDWEKDKARVIELMDGFMENKDKETWPSHPFFGPLTGLAWARVTWRHSNHHLTQFGV